MIIVQLLGGLGNQMFQYALGRQLALLNKAPLKLDTSTLLDWSPGRHAVNRKYDLGIFNVDEHIASKSDIARYNSQLMTIPEKVIFRAKNKLFGNKVTSEPHFHFNPDILKLTGDQYLTGTWQSYKYFEGIEPVIRRDFSFKNPPSAKASALSEKINTGVSVCLNVRRTDYVNVAATAEALSFTGIDYYKQALDLMTSTIGVFNVYVFSDDVQWCRENLGFITQPVVYVDHDYAGERFSDYLWLMSRCHHYIIPNSTFAWWGAWLNDRQDKTVITPKKWMNDPAVNTADLVPGNWIRI